MLNSRRRILLPSVPVGISSTPLPSIVRETHSAVSMTLGEALSRALEKRIALKRMIYKRNDFVFGRVLGAGSYGRVHVVRSTYNDTHYFAIKTINKARVVRQREVQSTLREAGILSSLQKGQRCPFIVTFWGAFHDSQHVYMIMEFAHGGDLLSLLRKFTRFSEWQARFYVAEVVVALDYLHQRNIMHRDLKPENILMCADGHIKVTDFGFAKECFATLTMCGTPDYMAPEILRKAVYTRAVDYYALGVITYELLAGVTPFDAPGPSGETVAGIYSRALSGVIYWPPPHIIPHGARKVISALMWRDPAMRLGYNGAQEVYKHPWFAGVNWHAVLTKRYPPPLQPNMNDPRKMFAGEYVADTEEQSSQSFGDLFRDFDTKFGVC